MKKFLPVVLAAVCLFCLVGCSPRTSTTLTLDTVIELSAKGEALTWSDFESYESTDIGSGLYIYSYEIDETFALWIGGVPDYPPMYMRLLTKADTDTYIDIRTDDVQAFVDAHRK